VCAIVGCLLSLQGHEQDEVYLHIFLNKSRSSIRYFILIMCTGMVWNKEMLYRHCFSTLL